MSNLKNDSPRPFSPSSRIAELVCTNCGHKFLGYGPCPRCLGMTKSEPGGEDMLRKTFDEPDLVK